MPKNEIQRRLRRAKDSERRAAKWMIEHDGPDPRYPPGSLLVTSTGRVGHVTGLQFDILSRTYAGENKHTKVPAGLWKFWKQIVSVAAKQGKEPCIILEPAMPETRVDGTPIPVMHMISERRHGELLRAERALIAIQEATVQPTDCVCSQCNPHTDGKYRLGLHWSAE